MQGLQNTITLIRAQLGKLSVNARLLLGAMMVILAMALLLVSQYAGKQAMMPLGLPNTAEVRAAALQYLETAGIPHEDRGSDVYVQAGKQYQVVGQLSEKGVVGADQIDFNALIDRQANPFVTRDQSRQMWLTAKMNGLSAIISEWEKVDRATVLLGDAPVSPGIGRAAVIPTAAVSVRLRNGALTQEEADAIGRMVAASHAGLKPENVAVTDAASSRVFYPRTEDELSSGMYLEQKQRIEKHYQSMLENALRFVGAVISVNAVIKNTRETSNVRTVDEPVIGPRSSESRDFSSTGAGASGEAGLTPNSGASIRSAKSGPTVSESISKERMDAEFGGESRVIEDATGYPIQVNAYVGVPRSYFVKMYRDQQGDAEASPDAATLQPIIDQQVQEWETDLAVLIKTDGLADAITGTVRVRMISDFDGGGAIGGGMPNLASTDGIAGLLQGGGMVKNVALGALALLSLLMMFFMVKRANHREALPTAAESAGVLPSLGAEEGDIVGEAEEGEPVLDGVELDEATLRMQELLRQINEMVQARPEEAASLFQRWATSETG